MKLYDYNNQKVNLKQLSDSLGVRSNTMLRWINNYGLEGAIAFAKKTPDERKEITAERIRQSVIESKSKDSKFNQPIPKPDPLHEVKQRVSSWIAQGVPTEQIKMRLRLSRESAL